MSSETSIHSTRTYLFVYLSLLVLLALTIAGAFLFEEPLHSIVSVVIAFLKAGLVAAFFMGLRTSSGRTRLLLGGSLLLLLILISLTLVDYFTRFNGLPFQG